MSDEITEAEVRTTRDVAQRMHATNAERGTEYRMDPGLAAAALTLALDALDTERARVAEWTAEARERDAEVARWQSEARDLVRVLADVRQRCGGYPDSRVDGDGGIVAVVVRERDEAQGALVVLREEADHWLDGPADTNGDALLRTAIAATPATLAGQVRARVLREAAVYVEQSAQEVEFSCSIGTHIAPAGAMRGAASGLRTLADEAERSARSGPTGDGGIVAVVVRERDEARGTVAALHERAASVLRGEADAIAALPVARLPVIATCGQCHDCDPPSYDTKPDERKAYCVHPAASAPPDNPATRVDRNASPPEWCPLRRETP